MPVHCLPQRRGKRSLRIPGWERLLADQEQLAETVSHPALLGRL